MKKITCPVCRKEVYISGNHMAETEVRCVVVTDVGNEYMTDEGKLVNGRLICTPEDLTGITNVHEIHPCTYWEQHKDKLADIVAGELGWWPEKDCPGTFYSEIYADYRDELDEKTAIEILSAEDPMQALQEKLWSWYDEAQSDIQNKLISAILTKIPELEAVEDTVREWVYNYCDVRYPMDHYLKQDVYINIEVDTGDANYEFVLNHVYPAYDCDSDQRIDDHASILWLAKQQGYTKTQLWKAMVDNEYGGSKFLESMRQEVLNVSTHMNTLTFLWKTSLEEAIALAELVHYKESVAEPYDASKSPYCGYIVLDKKTPCGLYDSWNGGGSLFEIELDKDVRLPARFIFRALPDGAHGYSIESCYGVCGKFWEGGGVKEVHIPKNKKNAAS